MITKQFKSLLAAGVILLGGGLSAFATTINVPDGDFSTGNGSVGGGLLFSNGSSVIGTSPWTGVYNGVNLGLGLGLVPPVLTIGSGVGTISGIAAVGLLGLNLADSSGYFYQSLSGASYAPNTTYTLTADVSAGTVLTAALLASSNAGIGLTNGAGTLVDSTTTTPSNLLSITLLGGNTYQVALQFSTSVSTPTGPIGIELFDTPANLVSASLLSGVAFDNVTLSSNPTATPEPAAMLLSGAGLLGIGLIRRRLRRRA